MADTAAQPKDAITQLSDAIANSLSFKEDSSSHPASIPVSDHNHMHVPTSVEDRQRLKDHFLSRITQWPYRFTTAPASIHQRIISHMDPIDYHRVAPTISKSWRNYVRERPRPVLLNLRIVVDEKTKGVTVKRPVPFVNYSELNERFKGIGKIGEGSVVTCSFRECPDDAEGMRAFLGKITEVLRSWVPDAVGELKSTKSYVMVVPWEVQLSGTQLTKPKDLERLSKILAFLDPRVVKIFRPPQILFHLLPHNIHVLHVSCNPHDEPLDFSPLENVETLRFGKKLYRLVLDGPVVTDGKETEEEGDEVEELPGIFDPEDLEAIGELNGLTDFRIGTFFPLSDYTGIIPIINKLIALKTLSVRGFYYGDQPNESLASLFTSLPSLTSFSTVGDLEPPFWSALTTAVSSHPVQNLKTLSLTFQCPNLPTFTASLRGVVTNLPSVTTLRVSLGQPDCARLTPKAVVDAVKELQIEWIDNGGKCALKEVYVSGMRMTMDDVVYMGRYNLASTPAGGISVQIKSVREDY